MPHPSSDTIRFDLQREGERLTGEIWLPEGVGERLTGEIWLPEGISGELVWGDTPRPLTPGRNALA